MTWKLIRWYLWLKFLEALSGVAGQQRFAREPEDQIATLGSRVTLPCRVLNKSGALQWTKDDFALGSHRNLTEYGRYTMIGTDEEGDFSLSIEQVQLEDDARYQCQVGSGSKGEPGIRSKFATITVLVPPEKPEILTKEPQKNGLLVTTEDKEIELECVSRAGKPPAEITWIDGLGVVAKKNVDYRITREPHSKLSTARSVLKVIPKKEYHNKTFICQANNDADRTHQTAKIKIYVNYAPKVALKLANSTAGTNIYWRNQLVEGMDLRLTCEANANPRSVYYRWYINDQEQEGVGNRTELVIANITRYYHGSIVKCEAENTVGRSEDSETLQVVFGPKFSERPKSNEADYDSNVTLTCMVDGNPPPDISWIQESVNKVIGKSSTLTVKVTEETSSRYYCRAYTQGFPEINAEAAVYLKRRPKIRKGGSATHTGVIGETIRMECESYAVPKATKVAWTFGGREIVAGDSHYAVFEEELIDGVRSTLLLKTSRREDFGIYNCSVYNALGVDWLEIDLKATTNIVVYLPAFGMGVGILMVIIGIIIIVIMCHRKTKKTTSHPPPPAIVIDSEKCRGDSDGSSNISDLKLEIRTGSSASNCNGNGDVSSDYTGMTVLNGMHHSHSHSHPHHHHHHHDFGPPESKAPPHSSSSLSLDNNNRYAGTNGNACNRFSNGDYIDPVLPPAKLDGHNNNGYVPYVDYTRDYTPPPTTRSPFVSGANGKSDARYAAAYGYARSSSGVSLAAPIGQPPPPPYCTLRNGSARRYSPVAQYIVADGSNQTVLRKGSLATHV